MKTLLFISVVFVFLNINSRMCSLEEPQTSVESSIMKARCSSMFWPGFFNSWNMEQPSFYSIIPANVRYDKDLSPFQIVLYGEISALTNKHGYCFASNSYFAELFGKSSSNISRSINNLARKGYLDIELDKVNVCRKIYLAGWAKMPRGLGKNAQGARQKCPGGLGKNAQHNTTRDNTISNTIINKDEISEKNDFEKTEADQVLLFLIDLTRQAFPPNSKRFINERLKEGFTVNQLCEIVELKYFQSQQKEKGRPVFDPRYVRPSTLFSINNCQNYVNEVNKIKSGEIQSTPFGKSSTKERLQRIARELGVE